MEQILESHLYILGTILFTVYGQLVVKWQVNLAGPIHVNPAERFSYFVKLILNPWVISSLMAAFLAFLSWVGAMSKFELSYAYPFTSLSFVLVLSFSACFFNEVITMPKIFGLTFIMLGIIVGSQG